MGDVIELFGAQRRPNGWTEQEKAELYRAAAMLGARGLPFDSEFGSTDDGDPWFLFIGRGTGEVLAHFARIDGKFVVHHAAADVVFESRDIRDLVDRVLVFPDRAIGRASGDAFYSHLAVTAAALALSLDSLSVFFDEAGEGPLLLAAPAIDEMPTDQTAAWLLTDDDSDSVDAADTIAGGDDPELVLGGEEVDGEFHLPGARVHIDDLPPAPAAATGEAVAASADVPSFDDDGGWLADELPFAPVLTSFDGAILAGSAADDTMVGTSGSDFLVGGDGHDLILAGAGNDIVLGGRGNDTILGGEGDDVLVGGEGNDQLHGGPGDDLLLGGPGDDLLHGGKGNDTLQGFSGRDTLSGDSGDDLLLASDGEAVLIGGDGTNIFHFAPGSAIAYAGADRDIFVYEEGERSDVVIHDFDPDQDELYYLDPSGVREMIDVAREAVDGMLVIQASLGGRLTILFDDPVLG